MREADDAGVRAARGSRPRGDAGGRSTTLGIPVLHVDPHITSTGAACLTFLWLSVGSDMEQKWFDMPEERRRTIPRWPLLK